MRTNHLFKILAVLVLCPALAARGATPVLDQSQINFSSSAYANESYTTAQTFTPGIGGTFAQLDLFLGRADAGDASPLVISIADTSGGVPNHILGSTTFNGFGSYWNWYSINLSSLNITLNAGSLYAIELSCPGSFSGVDLGGDVYGPDYPRGMTLVEDPTGDGGWQVFPRAPELTFQTWMVVPEPSAMVLITAGFLCLALMRCVGKRI